MGDGVKKVREVFVKVLRYSHEMSKYGRNYKDGAVRSRQSRRALYGANPSMAVIDQKLELTNEIFKNGAIKMKELHQVVSDKLTEMINSGVVEEIIAKNLTKTVEEGVKEALKTYGEFGKAIREKIEKAIMVSEPDIHLPLYNTFIAEHVNTTFSRVMNESALSQFDAIIADALKPVPKESKFSAVMDLIKDCWQGESEHGSVEIEANESNSGEALYVTIKHPEYDWYNIKVTFYCFNKKTWHIGYLRIGDKTLSVDPKKYADNGLGSTSLGDELFKFYLAKTEFEADEAFESIGYDY